MLTQWKSTDIRSLPFSVLDQCKLNFVLLQLKSRTCTCFSAVLKLISELLLGQCANFAVELNSQRNSSSSPALIIEHFGEIPNISRTASAAAAVL